MQKSTHEFSIGRAYAYEKVWTAEEYLNAALRAEHYIAKFQEEDEDGIYWTQNKKLAPDVKFLTGSAGVLYFYIKLAKVTKEEKYRQIAEKAVQYICRHWNDQLDSDNEENPYAFMHKGLFGTAGTAFALLEAYNEYGAEETRRALSEVGSYYQKNVVRDGQGARWTGRTAYAFDGAIALFLIELYERFHDETIPELLDEVGKWYVSQGELQPDGAISLNGGVGLGFNQADTPGNRWSPNFELGTAGAAYALARIAEVTGKQEYLDTAKKCAQYLESIAVRQDKGYLIPYWVNTAESPIFYLGNCHGPAGTSKLFYQLYKQTGDRHFFEQIVQLVDGIESMGAPERQSAGFWNNYSICCGNAALVQFFLALYQADGDLRWRELAVRAGNVLFGEREDSEDGSTSWTIAFERIRPDVFSTDYTYNNGAAGIGCVLLQLYLNETGQFAWRRLPDDPYPENPV